MTIRKESDQQVYLLSGVQMNSTHAELFSYVLFRDELRAKSSSEFVPLKLYDEYMSSSKSEVEPGIRFIWNYRGKSLELEIECLESGYEFYFYSEEVAEIKDLKKNLEMQVF